MAGGGGTITVKVKIGRGKVAVTVPSAGTVGDLRAQLDPTARTSRLVFSGKTLGNDGARLEDVGVMHNCVIMCAGEQRVDAPPAAAAADASTLPLTPPPKRHKPDGEGPTPPGAPKQELPYRSASSSPPHTAGGHQDVPAQPSLDDDAVVGGDAGGDQPMGDVDGMDADEAAELALALKLSAADAAGGAHADADSHADPEMDEELAAALQLSREVAGRGEKEDADVEDDDPELAAAIALSKEGGEEAGEKEKKAEAQEPPPVEPEEVDFERFDSSNVVVAEGTIEELEKYYTEDERFVDPQFPPHPKSIYMDPKDAERWVCNLCGRANPLPPVERPPTTQEEAIEKQKQLDAIKCGSAACAGKPTHVQLVNIVNRPATWLRPGVRCAGCEMILACMPGVQDVKSLASRQCTHYLRDDITNNTTGMSWRVVRESPRPEDVYQGALGNCWFGGALACVAAKPELVDRLLVTKQFSRIGAYIVALHHSGAWRKILLDDTFPCSAAFEGRIEPNGTIYFSQGGLMCFAKTARQSLWAPLVEKAAAKLFGSYGALSGGTLGEALQLLTGYACDTMPLRVDPQELKRRQQRREQIVQARMQMFLQGKNPDTEGVPDPDADAAEALDNEDPDVLWLRLVSAVEAGYILGTACSAEACGHTKQHFNETLGLQTPHAYSVLRLEELEHDGKTHRLLQFRNPWGERAPRTWKGTWGKDWAGWTRELKVKLGVTNAAGVAMYDPMSTFWMDFDDMRKYFPTIDICRVHPADWKRVDASGWLPSELGPGNAFELTTYRRTALDLVLWQEKHITRESAVHALSTNHDIGFYLLRRKVLTDGETDDAAGWKCIDASARSVADQVSVEITLEGGYRYRVVPFSIGLMQAARLGKRLRKATLAVYSNEKVGLDAVSQDWRELSACLAHGVCEHGRGQAVPGAQGDGHTYYTTKDKYGALLAVQNASKGANAVYQVDAEARGCLSTRVDNAFSTIAAVPARSRMLCLGVQINARGGFRLDVSAHPPESAGFADPPFDLHQPIPYLPTTAYPAPDPELLAVLDKEEEAEQEKMLQEAIAMSMSPDVTGTGGAGGGGGDDATDPDDDLAAALAMSKADEELQLALELSKHDPENEER